MEEILQNHLLAIKDLIEKEKTKKIELEQEKIELEQVKEKEEKEEFVDNKKITLTLITQDDSSEFTEEDGENDIDLVIDEIPTVECPVKKTENFSLKSSNCPYSWCNLSESKNIESVCSTCDLLSMLCLFLIFFIILMFVKNLIFSMIQ